MAKKATFDGSAALRVEYVPLKAIHGYARNARVHPKKQIDALKASIQSFGFNNPILVDANSTIVAGHGRYEAARQLELAQVPVIRLGHLTDTQRRAYILADNKIADMGKYDSELFASELSELVKAGGVQFEAIGIDSEEVTRSLQEAAEGPGLLGFVNPDDKELMEMKDDVEFPLEGVWELPELRRDMQLEIPDKLSLWTYKRITDTMQLPPPYFHNYRMDSTIGLDWSQTVVGFYTEDYRFTCFWDSPAESVKDLLKKNIIGAVAPNYTTAPIVSTTLRAYSTFQARYVARYMQEAGLRIVPDVNCWWYQSEFERVIEGLKGFHSLAFQMHQVFTGVQRARIAEAVDYAMDVVKPHTVLLYAPSEALTLYPALGRARVVRVEPNMGVKAQYRKVLDRRDMEMKADGS